VGTIIQKAIKSIRLILATSFIILVLFLILWCIKEDDRLKFLEATANLPKFAIIHYELHINSFEVSSKKIRATLTMRTLPTWLMGNTEKQHTIFWGSLGFIDSSLEYTITGGEYIESQIDFLKKGAYKTFRGAYSTSMSVGINVLGNPKLYPFDEYLVVFGVKCPAYYLERNKKIYIDALEDGETLSIKNSMTGLFISFATKKELDRIRASFGREATPNTKIEDMNNGEDRAALVIKRPFYLKFMTIILGIFSFAGVYYIGFRTPFKDLPIHIIGYVLSLWGIRSILFQDTKIHLSYFDYTVLFMYCLLFAGIIFRVIKGTR
jgi:hypothetical protein